MTSLATGDAWRGTAGRVERDEVGDASPGIFILGGSDTGEIMEIGDGIGIDFKTSGVGVGVGVTGVRVGMTKGMEVEVEISSSAAAGTTC